MKTNGAHARTATTGQGWPAPDDVAQHERGPDHEQRRGSRPVPGEGGVRADLELPRRVGAAMSPRPRTSQTLNQPR